MLVLETFDYVLIFFFKFCKSLVNNKSSCRIFLSNDSSGNLIFNYQKLIFIIIFENQNLFSFLPIKSALILREKEERTRNNKSCRQKISKWAIKSFLFQTNFFVLSLKVSVLQTFGVSPPSSLSPVLLSLNLYVHLSLYFYLYLLYIYSV